MTTFAFLFYSGLKETFLSFDMLNIKMEDFIYLSIFPINLLHEAANDGVAKNLHMCTLEDLF